MEGFRLTSISACASELPQVYVHFKDWMIFNEKEEKEAHKTHKKDVFDRSKNTIRDIEE